MVHYRFFFFLSAKIAFQLSRYAFVTGLWPAPRLYTEGELATSSPLSASDRSTSGAVLPFGWPSSFFAATSFFSAAPFLGVGLVFLMSVDMVLGFSKSRADVSVAARCWVVTAATRPAEGTGAAVSSGTRKKSIDRPPNVVAA